ncbi:surface antigen-like protein [Leishmania donovani]|uniref:Surface antigen-like protein n=1 Tax=Leishmania donovani TaxID=5661 RepID=A0A3S5H6D6_LEIDO|nr:surface antigen-like protein [Leishmania donovani]
MAQQARRLSMAALMAFVVYVLLLAGGVTRAALTAAQNSITAEFLRSFAVSIPGLASVWTGDDWCTWPYVSCNADTNITVIIDNAGFTGSLPELNVEGDSANIAVTEISLTNVDIGGGFKNSWGGLKKVRVLNFTNTNLFGTIPASWNAMRSLQTVILKNSSACGSLPRWTLPSLKNIDVSNNLLRGSMPDTLGYIAGLQNVSLVGNNFCGCSPPSWVSRVLTSALFQAMGSAPYKPNCRAPINCGSEGAKCSRDPPQYRDAAAAPLRVVVAVLTLVLALVCNFSV